MKAFLVLAVASTLVCGCDKFSKKTPEATVKTYLQAKQWEERLKLVRKPEQVRSLMAQYYKDSKFPASFVEVKPAQKWNFDDGDWHSVQVVFAKGKNAFGVEVEDSRFYFLQKTSDGYMIHWESSAGYNQMSWAEFKAVLPQKAVKFRLIAKLDDHYPFERTRPGSLQDEFWSICVSGNEEFVGLTGYVKKSSPDGGRIFELLKDGKSHPLICLLRCPNPTLDREDLFFDRQLRYVMIDKLVEEGWLEK